MSTRKGSDQLQVIPGNLDISGEESGDDALEFKFPTNREFNPPQKGANVPRRKSVLGRGLSALLTSSAVPVDLSNIPLAGVGGAALAEEKSEKPEKSSSDKQSTERTSGEKNTGGKAPSAREQKASLPKPFPADDTPPPIPSPFVPLPVGSAGSSANAEASAEQSHPTSGPPQSFLEDDGLIDGGLVYLSVDRVHANPDQPRRNFPLAELEELSETIKKTGLLQPLVVRRKGGESGQLAAYEIVAGERRFRAAKMAGLVKIPAILKQLDDQEAFEIGIIENVQRSNLNPIEEALAYQRLIDSFGSTQSEVAEKVGKDRASVANLLRLLKLDAEVQQYLVQGELSAGHGRALLRAESSLLQKQIAKRILAEGLSVRDTEILAQGGELSEKQESEKSSFPLTPSSSAPHAEGNGTVRGSESFPSAEDEISGSLDGGTFPERGIIPEERAGSQGGKISSKIQKSPEILALEEELRRRLGTKISLQLSDSGRGELRISFFSVEELEGLVEKLRE